MAFVSEESVEGQMLDDSLLTAAPPEERKEAEDWAGLAEAEVAGFTVAMRQSAAAQRIQIVATNTSGKIKAQRVFSAAEMHAAGVHAALGFGAVTKLLAHLLADEPTIEAADSRVTLTLFEKHAWLDAPLRYALALERSEWTECDELRAEAARLRADAYVF